MILTDGPRGACLRLKRKDDLPEHPTPRIMPEESKLDLDSDEVLLNIRCLTLHEHDLRRQREHGWIN